MPNAEMVIPSLRSLLPGDLYNLTSGSSLLPEVKSARKLIAGDRKREA